MKYETFIANILESRPNEKQEGVYMECHHITPKCLGGSNDKDNLIYLTAREHFIAHKLLHEENPNHCGLSYAFWNMCQCKRDGRYIPSPEEYEEYKKDYIASISGENSPFYGKKFSEEHRANLSKAQRGKKRSEEHRKKISIAGRGKHHTEETKQKMRECNLGAKNPMYGRKKTVEERRACGVAVINLDTGKVFYTLVEATEFYKISNKVGITACLHGRQKTAGGYHWAYYNKDINNGENK